MVPIHQVLSRIRWDPHFGSGEFEIGYYDRVEDRVVVVPFCGVEFPADKPHALRIFYKGEPHDVPLHRVREVYKNGRRIWFRSPLPGEQLHEHPAS